MIFTGISAQMYEHTGLWVHRGRCIRGTFVFRSFFKFVFAFWLFLSDIFSLLSIA